MHQLPYHITFSITYVQCKLPAVILNIEVYYRRDSPPRSCMGPEQMSRLIRHFHPTHLPEQGNIVHFPVGAAMGGNNQVVLFYCDPHHRGIGQIVGKGLPYLSALKGNIYPMLGAQEKQVLLQGIFTYGMTEVILPYPAYNLLPGLPVIVRPPHIRSPVIHLISPGTYKCHGRIMG